VHRVQGTAKVTKSRIIRMSQSARGGSSFRRTHPGGPARCNQARTRQEDVTSERAGFGTERRQDVVRKIAAPSDGRTVGQQDGGQVRISPRRWLRWPWSQTGRRRRRCRNCRHRLTQWSSPVRGWRRSCRCQARVGTFVLAGGVAGLAGVVTVTADGDVIDADVVGAGPGSVRVDTQSRCFNIECPAGRL
jgi:hypothetical protein